MLAFLIAISSAFNNFIVASVNQRDTNKPFYEIHFPLPGFYQPPNNHLTLSTSVTPMQMVSALGQVFTCVLPTPQIQPAPSPPSPEHVFDDIEDLFTPFKQRCYLRSEGWWTYEFCYGKHVIQKHIIPDRKPLKDEVEDTFVLGVFDPEADRIRRKNASQVSTSDAAFTQLFTNGTLCDMTNQPRRVTVKYLCNEDALHLNTASSRNPTNRDINAITAIREIESCVYEIEFINSAICQHSSYRAKVASNSRAIHCSLEEGQKPFEGLATTSYQPSSLSL